MTYVLAMLAVYGWALALWMYLGKRAMADAYGKAMDGWQDAINKLLAAGRVVEQAERVLYPERTLRN